MAVNPMIECYSRDRVPKYCHGVQSSALYTAPLFFVESLPGRSNWSLPCLPFHIHAGEIIPSFLTSNINIGLYIPKALTMP